MSTMTEAAAEAAIGAAALSLRLPTVRSEAARLADDAARESLTHRAYLAAVPVGQAGHGRGGMGEPRARQST